MISRQDLRGRSDQRLVADADRETVEDHAIDVQKDAGPEADVEAVIAMERRPSFSAFSDGGEAFQQ